MKYGLMEGSRALPDFESGVLPNFDLSVPHAARMWNYWLGGKDHFAVDRDAAERASQAMPLMSAIACATRRFVLAAVQELAGAGGIRQFLDIGTGLPVGEYIHTAAQRVAPDARVVYVDNDPMVTSHARVLLVDRGTRQTDYLNMDLRDTSDILAGAARTLDFRRPVAVVLSAVLDFIPGYDDPWAIVARLREAVAPGSYILIAHVASDIESQAMAAMAGGYNQRAADPIRPRGRAQVIRFFDGMIVTRPGVVPATGWWRAGESDVALAAHFGLGLKPGTGW